MQERRSFPRFEAIDIIACAQENGELLGEVINLSRTGMLVCGYSELADCQILGVRLYFASPIFGSPFLDVETLVVWRMENQDLSKHIGFKFTNLPENVDVFENAISLLQDASGKEVFIPKIKTPS